jgi:S1-C subfamily serine protease
MADGYFAKTVLEALLIFPVAVCNHATACTAHARVATAVVQEMQNEMQNEMHNETQKRNEPCGWLGVQANPMTPAFAESLGMAEPYGAIFARPEPGSPAATAGIEQGDVLTAINGSPLVRSSDFAQIISMMAPGTPVYLDISRNDEAMQVKLILGSAQCRTNG